MARPASRIRIILMVFGLALLMTTPVSAEPLLFEIPNQAQFGTFVSGYLTFDPSGVYFAGPFDITVGAISDLLPARRFTNANTTYVSQTNSSFHALWVFNPVLPFDHLFLFIGFDSCTATHCIFEIAAIVRPRCASRGPSLVRSHLHPPQHRLSAESPRVVSEKSATWSVRFRQQCSISMHLA